MEFDQDILKKHGLRITHQRMAILDVLRATRSHPLAQEVYAAVRDRLPQISFGTVYRNLHLLADAGLVRELRVGDGPCRYEYYDHPHEHFFCRTCGTVHDLHMETGLERLEEMVQRQAGHLPEQHRLVFYGQCRDCLGEPLRSSESAPSGKAGGNAS